eukprot:CAMPEP_0117030198 /NCGR_PEP_ID=MMETSP0472-20121206/21801_1 /TAXON_ID=693140 ORGANISM="Tiarina fusus, Strain LIS" /NCGR_SAMPLE_ID=MMETSP0472 /ASSEMBLY_ACC=CAM_ASM_000603 /LENGTH=274 /DNA_ID=CAMNT_0004738173 /DNA_START=81 /DNA_END=905 /DNA_ORIENTATION=-
MISRCRISRRAYFCLLAVCLFSFFCVEVAARRGGNKQRGLDAATVDTVRTDDGHDDDKNDDMESVHFLVELIAKEIYNVLKKPKYKFYIYMTIGKLPSEQSTIFLLSTLCNVLYGICILSGFLLLQRGPMLFFTLATMWVGPALVLILLGLVGLVLAAFALYPIEAVGTMCVWFFLTSQLAQTIGKRLGMDSDGDGDVDWLDLLHVLAKTRGGELLGLMSLHNILNQANQDPWQEVHHRLNEIDRNTRVANRRLSLEEEQSTINTNGNGTKTVR